MIKYVFHQWDDRKKGAACGVKDAKRFSVGYTPVNCKRCLKWLGKDVKNEKINNQT